MSNFKFLGYTIGDFSIESYYLIPINIEYNKNNFKNIYKLFNIVYANPFLSEKDKKHITNIYNKNLKIKSFLLKKILYYKYSKRDSEPLNKEFLDLSSSTNNVLNTHYIDIYINLNKKQYHRFTINELIQLFKFGLTNQEESIPNPFIPKNPYTGLEFTMSEIINIYIYIKNNNIELPFILRIFKQSGFNISKMISIHKIFLLTESSQNYIKNLSNQEFDDLFNDYYKQFNIQNIACKKCIIQLPNYRELFQPILIKYIYESNIEINLNYDNIDSSQMFINLINFYEIKIEQEHRHIVILNL